MTLIQQQRQKCRLIFKHFANIAYIYYFVGLPLICDAAFLHPEQKGMSTYRLRMTAPPSSLAIESPSVPSLEKKNAVAKHSDTKELHIVMTGVDDNGHLFNNRCDFRLLSRRSWMKIMPASASGCFLFGSWPSEALAATISSDSGSLLEDDPCRNGAVVPEMAIPGAYKQVCMDLPVRNVPLTVPRTGKSILLRVQQGSGQVGSGSTGMAVWNSSLLLTRLLSRLAQSKPDFLVSKTVIELGCGPGLATLALAALASDYAGRNNDSSLTNTQFIATDGNPAVVELAQRNIDSNRQLLASLTKGDSDENSNIVDSRSNDDNQKNIIMNVKELPWGLLNAMDYDRAADIIVGSDLTYNAVNWPVLCETLEACLKDDGFILYLTLGHSGFNVKAEINGFLEVAKSQGLVAVSPGSEVWPFPGIQYPSLTDLLLTECVSSVERRTVIDTTGGVQALVLQKKKRKI